MASQIEREDEKLKSEILSANTAMEALEIAQNAGVNLPEKIASLAQKQAIEILRGAPVEVEIMIFARDGNLLARTN